MSQEIYDAARSRISPCDTGSIFERAIHEIFGNNAFQITCAVQEIAASLQEPHVIMRPRLFMDGDQWCALYGEDLHSGVAGFGDSPAKACADFNREWHKDCVRRK